MLPGQMHGWIFRFREHCAQLFQGYRVTGGVLADPDSQEREPLSVLSVGLHTAWRRAQDREQWQRTVEAAMLYHGGSP